MNVGIVSDTHDNLDVVTAAVDYLSEEADVVLHCGDMVAPFTAAQFDGDFDFYAVRGNNDGEWSVQETVDRFGVYLGEMGKLSFEGASFAVYHGTAPPIVDALVASGQYDYVVHGHTHERAHEEQDGTVRISPGGVPIDPEADSEPPAAVLVDTDTGEVTFHDLA
jgi:putative phosphoesterase